MKKERIYMVLLACLVFQADCARTWSNPAMEEEEDLEMAANDSLLLAQYLADAYCPHEISVWMGGGLSSLNYRPTFGKTVNGFGGAFGVGYAYFFNRNWGLSSGLEYAFYQGKTDLNGFAGTNATFDILDNPVIYNTGIEHYSEKQFAGLLNIPLSVLFQTGNNQRFYASAGLKFGLPVSAKYSGGNAVLTASGYYPDYNQTEIWQNDLGYGVFNLNEKKYRLDLGVSVMGTLETGVKWDTGIGTALYTGVYMDYGFNNALSSSYSGKQLVEYNRNEPAKPVMNTVCVLANRFSPVSFGVKVKLAFSVSCADLLAERRKYRDMQTSGYWENDVCDYFPPVESATQAAITNDTADKVESDTVPSSRPEIIATDTIVKTAGTEVREMEISFTLPSLTTIDGYKLGQVAMTPEQKSILDKYAVLLQENPQTHIEITGHACDTGTKEENLRIGQRRADGAKDYLTGKGIPSSRIFTRTKGDSEPVSPDSGEENRRKNRRLEIKLFDNINNKKI
jgi:outer membrane protein OmpA-like peptidoglycan-associated protein